MWDRRVAALTQVTVADISAPTLAKDDKHHVSKVLRASEGEEIVVTDGRGSFALAQWMGNDVHLVTPVMKDTEPPHVALYLAPLKGDHSENVIHKAAEMGVSSITPLMTRHVSVKFSGEAKEKILGRWRRIARDASGQCRRTYELEIRDPVAISEVPSDVAFATLDAPAGDWTGVSCVAIGPEGGFADGEIPDGARRVSLGSTVLRAETAAMTAAAFMSVLQGGGVVSLATPPDLP